MNKQILGRGRLSSFFLTLFGLNQKAPWYFILVLKVVYLAVFLLIWQLYFPPIIPRPLNILSELVVLITKKGMLYELGSTLKSVSNAMIASVLLAGTISITGHVFNFMRPIRQIVPLFCFWSTLGFASIIRILSTGDSFQFYLLLFGIVPFLVTAFNRVLNGVEKDDLYDYARTMGYPEWKCVWYVVIRNRLSRLLMAVVDTFAIAWVMAPYVEVANRDGGGIGAMLFDYVRYMIGDDPYAAAGAIQLTILSVGATAYFGIRKAVLLLAEEAARAKSTKS